MMNTTDPSTAIGFSKYIEIVFWQNIQKQDFDLISYFFLLAKM